MSFDSPTIAGVPLDYCLTFGTGCGEEAARHFCQKLQGFANVSDYQQASKYASQTYIPSDGTFCQDQNCQTFESITCTGWFAAAGAHGRCRGKDARAPSVARHERMAVRSTSLLLQARQPQTRGVMRLHDTPLA